MGVYEAQRVHIKKTILKAKRGTDAGSRRNGRVGVWLSPSKTTVRPWKITRRVRAGPGGEPGGPFGGIGLMRELYYQVSEENITVEEERKKRSVPRLIALENQAGHLTLVSARRS